MKNKKVLIEPFFIKKIYNMSPNKRMYIDFFKITELLSIMSKMELINFLNKRIVIPIDDESYEFLIQLKKESDLIIKNS